MSFVHLNVQSDYSFLTSSITVDGLCARVKELGQTHVALTDHANLFGAMALIKAAQKNGIKPIIGARIFLVDDLGRKGPRPDVHGLAPQGQPTPEGGIYSLTLLAQSHMGYQNLCALLTWAYQNGVQEKPLVTRELIRAHNEGILCLSGTLRGEVASLIALDRVEEAEKRARFYQDVFGVRYYFEAQSTGIHLQKKVNAGLAELSSQLGIGVCATNDCHYIHREDSAQQEILMNIGLARNTADEDFAKFMSTEHFVKSDEEMRAAFAEHPDWCDLTSEIAKQCHVKLSGEDASGKAVYHLPAYTEGERTAEDILGEKARAGLAKRLDLNGLEDQSRKTYEERLATETAVITKMGFAGYFLIVADFIQWAKSRGIPVGPGRGSGAGSLVSYALQITDLDPIRHNLLFERFLNPERISMPDFDVDFCMDRRGEVIEYVRQKYGADRVAQIITYGKMQAKGVLRDVGRVFGVPHEDMDRFTKLVPNELKMTLEKALQVEPRIQEWLDRDPRMQDVMNMAMKLEGLHRHAGIHAAGVIIADNPITHYCPLYQSADGDWMTQFDWVSCETIGLIKFDFLGLKTLTAIQKTEEWLRQRGQPDFRIENIPYDDPGMYQLIARGDTIGVFQLESSGMQDLCRKIQPTNFEDITAINALYRPGPLGSGMVDDFINRKKGTTPITYDLAQLEPILRETYGIIVYQEQVQRIAVELASYTLGGADLLRRAMGKKKPEEMAKQREFFLSGARKNGHNPQVAENIFNLMEKFAEYGFNKSHAAAYMMVAAQTAYLKAHFPVEFYAAQMTIESGNTEQISRFIEDARRHGITVLAPHLNESEAAFTPVGESSIRFGMSSIKGVGEAAVAHLVEERRKNGAYKDLIDVIRRVDGRAVNKRVFEALIKAGVLDFSGIPRARMMAALPDALKSGERFHRDQETSQTMLFSGDDLSMTQKSFWEGYAQVAEWELTQKLGLEFDVLGSFLSGHPLEKYLAKSELYITTTLSQIQNKAADSKATVSGVVLEKRERRTRKGDKMMYVTIGDLTGTADVIVFPEAFRKFEAVLRSGEPLLVSGEVSRDQMSQQGQLRVGRDGLIRSLEQLTVSKRAEVHITMEDSADGTKMLHVAEVLKRYPGSCPTFLRVKGKVGEARLRLPSELQVELSDSMVKEIVDLCGAHSVHFVADA